MEHIPELAFGKGFIVREEKFEKGVEQIEERHKDFFLNRESRLFQGEPDKLENHIITTYDGHKVRISLREELPETIKNEIMSLFYSVWKLD